MSDESARAALIDPIRAGIAGGWHVIDAATLVGPVTLEADAVIVGTGAGGGVTAEILADAGLSVILVEEGPLKSSSDFRMREAEAYPDLYQESAARKTKDKAISILQGRCVGGGTTVNWTSSFRTPPITLAHWAHEFGITGFSADDLKPWFERMEARLAIAPWTMAPNANNTALAVGTAKLGYGSETIRRNVKGCRNLGYCGMGCPTNAKQSMLITTIPAALNRGATLVTRARAIAFEWRGDRVQALHCAAMDARGTMPTSIRVTIRSRTYIAAAGAIGTPALLLRSGVPDPHSVVGRRTFLHPAAVSAALMPERVDGFSGAPQSIYSDQFLDAAPADGPIGFKLEAPPIHPLLTSTTLPNHGLVHAEKMHELRHLHVLIALLRDGFHPQSRGGTVRIDNDGTPVLDYPLNDYLFDGVRRAMTAMADIQFAAGARSVMPVHGDGATFTRADDAKSAIGNFALRPLATPLFSAHVMGGAPLGPDPRRAAVDLQGRYHHLANLHVVDGSLFPTSIGANPQLSIYAVAAKLATDLAAALKA
ncbi:MAG TPA: GMC family oxidoreductase [Casimicrobiaceae bacterium]|nr:GMC family oxidoreductase [Casimicrobiaceae bacterium]